MTQAVEVAKQLAALVSAVISAEFRVYAFDTAAFDIKAKVPEGKRPALSDWEAAFKFIKANGGTSIGVALTKLLRDKIYVEQIILVTDDGENTPPLFRDAWTEYAKEMHVAPSVIIVKVGGSHAPFEKGLQERGIEVMGYEFKGEEYYALPNLLPLLALPSKAELVDAIMKYDLPRRPTARVEAHS